MSTDRYYYRELRELFRSPEWPCPWIVGQEIEIEPGVTGELLSEMGDNERPAYGEPIVIRANSVEVARIGAGVFHGMAWFTRKGFLDPLGRRVAHEIANANGISPALLADLRRRHGAGLNKSHKNGDLGILVYVQTFVKGLRKDTTWDRYTPLSPVGWVYRSMTELLYVNDEELEKA